MSEPRLDADLALLLDVGSAWAKASVIGRVRGRWRLVTHAAQPTAWGAAELRRSLVDRLAAAADARLRGRIEELVASANRIECHTPRRPGRLALVAVSRDISGSAARRAAEAAGWQVAESVTLDDGRALADRLARLQDADVDAWLVAGGFDDGMSRRGMEAAALVASARRSGGGPVVWAGSAPFADAVIALFEPGAATAVANPRPDHRRENGGPLRDHLQGLLRGVAIAERETENLAPVAFPRAVGALAAAHGLRVLAVDLGARGAIRAVAEPDGATASRLHAHGGLSGAILVPGAPGRVARLAADAGDDATIADLLQTLRARPSSVPQTRDELVATHAVARLQLAALVDDDPPGPVDLVIGAGRTLAAAPHPAHAMQILLDGLRPIGVTQLAVDAAAVLGPMGSLAGDEIREGIALLGDDLVVPLGTAVTTRGGEPGRLAMRVTVHRSGWPSSSPIDVRVGQLQLVPLGRGQEADLTIEPGEGVSLGAARRSPRIHATATGGAVGLVLDARGIPIAMPKRGDDRRAMLVGWREALVREANPLGERVA